MFQTWSKHILERVFAFGFNGKANSLREKPSQKSKSIYYNQDEFYQPSQILGELLQSDGVPKVAGIMPGLSGERDKIY